MKKQTITTCFPLSREEKRRLKQEAAREALFERMPEEFRLLKSEFDALCEDYLKTKQELRERTGKTPDQRNDAEAYRQLQEELAVLLKRREEEIMRKLQTAENGVSAVPQYRTKVILTG